jgi:KipI family sensor histidine kinase inhibitor
MISDKGNLRIRPAGDAAVVLDVGDRIDLAINRRVHAIAAALQRDLSTYGTVEIIPGYTNVLISYDPSTLTYEEVATVAKHAAHAAEVETSPPQRFVLPVAYGGEFGPDLEEVARFHHLSPEEVVRRHANRDYPIFCLGFSPGFPFLGGLDESLHTPRLETPRSRVPAGSVAIGGSQTGVYPTETPGGWRIIGRTPLTLFDITQIPPVVYRPGDVMRFVPIDAEEYAKRKAECQTLASISRPHAASIQRPALSRQEAVATESRHLLRIVQPGLLTVVRDRGRSGWEALGIARDGALDPYAYTWVNRLAANPPDAAVLEATLLGPTIVVIDDCWLATTGAQVTVDGREYPPWAGFWVLAGATVAITKIAGARAYLTVHGGIAVEPVLGSRSTDLESHFGGYQGRSLRTGDIVPVGITAPLAVDPGQSLQHPTPPYHEQPLTIEVVPGPRQDEFPPEALPLLLSSTFTLSPHSNHMGLRLDGAVIPAPPRGSRISEPMPVGGVQVTPTGQPIILLSARGTIGGYPLLATVTTPSSWKLGQARPGDQLVFRAVSVEEAQAHTRAAYRDLEDIVPVLRAL